MQLYSADMLVLSLSVEPGERLSMWDCMNVRTVLWIPSAPTTMSPSCLLSIHFSYVPGLGAVLFQAILQEGTY